MQAEDNTYPIEILTHDSLLQCQQALNFIPNRKFMNQEQLSRCFDLTVQLCRIKEVVELIVGLEEIRRTLLSKYGKNKQNMNINIDSDELLYARLTIQHLLSIDQAKELLICKEGITPFQRNLCLKLLNLPNIRSIIQWNSYNIHRQLCEAVKQLNVQLARKLISLGADVNFQLNMDNSYQTYATRSYIWKSASPLFLALRTSFRKDQQKSFVDMIELLLQNGADWKQFNTIIYQCIGNSYGNWESDNVFSALPQALDMFGDEGQRERLLRLLTSYQIDLNYLQRKQAESTYQSSSQNKSLMFGLLNKYFMRKTTTIYKRDRLDFIDNKFRDLLQQVLRFAVDVDSYKSKCSVDKIKGIVTWEYQSALHLCIKNNQTFLINYLLDRGASIDRDYISIEVGQSDGRITPNSKIVRTINLAKQYKIHEQIIKKMQKRQYQNTKNSHDVFDIISLAMKDNVNEKIINFLRWRQLGKNSITDMTD